MTALPHFLRAATLTALLTVPLVHAADSPWKPILTPAAFAQLVEADAKLIQDALAKGTPDKKTVTKTKTAAMMIALYAQSSAGRDGFRAEDLNGLRDKAVSLAQAIDAGQFDRAAQLAAELKPTGVGGGSSAAVELHKLIDLEELMSQFKPERGGGRELEKKLAVFWNSRRPLSADQLKELIPLANQTAIIAQYTEALAPERDEGNKKVKDWVKWCRDMGESSVEAALLAGEEKPNDKSVKAVLKRLEKSCTDCHNVFRDG